MKHYRPREQCLKYYKAHDPEKYEEVRGYYLTNGVLATMKKYGYTKNGLHYHFGSSGVIPPRKHPPRMMKALQQLKVIHMFGSDGMVKTRSAEEDVRKNYWYEEDAVLVRS